MRNDEKGRHASFVIVAVLTLVTSASADNLVIVGDGGIAHSDDGGATWTDSVGGQTPRLWDVKFVDSRYGWSAGHVENVVRTVDGGRTWSPTAGQPGLQDPNIALGIDFVDRNRGWLVHAGGIIMHTTDGGNTWLPQTSNVPFSNLFAVQFFNENIGWIAGTNSAALYTTNGGATWTNALAATYPQARPSFEGMHFVDVNHGWAVGIDGVISHTNDGGLTWTEQSSNTSVHLKSVDFVDTRNGFVGARDGTVLRTTDGGQTWQQLLSLDSPRAIYDVEFRDANTGWVVGGDYIFTRQTPVRRGRASFIAGSPSMPSHWSHPFPSRRLSVCSWAAYAFSARVVRVGRAIDPRPSATKAAPTSRRVEYLPRRGRPGTSPLDASRVFRENCRQTG